MKKRMTYFIKKKKEILQGIAFILLALFLFTTGLHTEVLGGIQQMILATGISKPQIPLGNSTVVLIADKEKINYKYDVKLTTLKGEEVNLSDLKGMVVFLNLWASWCPPCIAEMPNIQKLYDKVDKSKVAFVMLSLDKDEDKARKFIEKKKHSFPVYFLSEGLPEDLSTNSIPTTFVLDRNGNILTRHEGMADYDTEEFRNYLMSLTKK